MIHNTAHQRAIPVNFHMSGISTPRCSWSANIGTTMPTKRLASSSRKKASFCQSKTTVLRTVSSGESFGTEIHEEQRTENRREDNNMKPLLNVKQAAELCGISPWTVRSYIKQGKLLPVHIGRRVLIDESEIERFV